MIPNEINQRQPNRMAEKRTLRGQGGDFSHAAGIAKGVVISIAGQKRNYVLDITNLYRYNLTVEVEIVKIKNNSCSLVCLNRKVWQSGLHFDNTSGHFFLSKGEKMGRVIYKNPEERNRKISESHKGVKFSEERKKKISQSLTGRILSEEHIKNISKVKNGKHIGDKNPNYRGGKIEIKCLICKKTRLVIPSLLKSGRAKFCSRSCLGIYQTSHSKKSSTSIEIIIKQELIRREIQHIEQFAIPEAKTIVDFLLPGKTIIYCDGDYWHGRIKQKQKDARQDFDLNKLNYRVFRFWEHEIKKSAEGCLDRIYGGLQ